MTKSQPLNIVNLEGKEIKSQAFVGSYHDMKGIFLESRGNSGGKKNPKARNPEYNEGLKILLIRLMSRNITKLNIWVASRKMQEFPLEKCKIINQGNTYYINLALTPDQIRKDITSKQSKIKESPDTSKGGSTTKRIFINVENRADDEFLYSLIRGAEGDIEKINSENGDNYEDIDLILGENYIESINSEDVDNYEDIDFNEDRREFVLASIKKRRGEKVFRKALIKAYQGKCAITGCEIEEVLEAAHISPYKGEHTNFVSNGLLLRADIHTLFDLNLIGVDVNYRVVVSQKLSDSEYWQYKDTELKVIPIKENERPSVKALKNRCNRYGVKQ